MSDGQAKDTPSDLCGMLVIFDFNRTIYDPTAGELIPGAQDVLVALTAAGHHLALISMKETGREDLLDKVGIRHFFKWVRFVETDKSLEDFTAILNAAGAASSSTYVVGDHLHREIRFGNMLGMKTIWFKSGKFASLKPENEHDYPWQIVTNMADVYEIIRVDRER